jgi:hypothetical protein
MKVQNLLTGLGMAMIQLVVLGCLGWVAVILFVSCQMGLFVPVLQTPKGDPRHQIREQFTADARTCFAAIAYLLEPENSAADRYGAIRLSPQQFDGLLAALPCYSSNQSDYFNLPLPAATPESASRI